MMKCVYSLLYVLSLSGFVWGDELLLPRGVANSNESLFFWWPDTIDDELPAPDEEKVVTEIIKDPFHQLDFKAFEAKLKAHILGQDHAIKTTLSAIQRYTLGLNDQKAPIGAFLYVGPTGVGKTQLAKEIAKHIFGNENRLIRFNMSEFVEAHSITRLIGSPPGYVNHMEGGQLTEALKQNPYAIVLMDEIEKAHSSVRKLFLQLFDEGFITDARGNVIDCRKALFIMTTNLGGKKILTMHDLGHGDNEILKNIESQITAELSPELYNRMEPVVFRGFKPEMIEPLIQAMLREATEEIEVRRSIHINIDPSVIAFVKTGAENYALGARPLKHFIKQTVLTSITDAIKEGYLKPKSFALLAHQEGHLVLQNLRGGEPFFWKWSDKPSGEVSTPFRLENLLQLEEKLGSKILGQPEAVRTTTAALMRYAAGMTNPKTPIGSLLYIGPTGVGKTQLAKELAKELLGSEAHLIRLDMSEYSEPYTITRLIGSPPGYIGYNEGGQLTEALQQHPYAIVLLDEIEKAHPKVLKTFLQVFDEGHVSDAKGNVIDCRHVLFIMTTNLGAREILRHTAQGQSIDAIVQAIEPEVISFLTPELYNRLEVVVFKGLSDSLMENMVRNMLDELAQELSTRKSITLEFDETLIAYLKVNGFDFELGARPLKRLIQTSVVNPISAEIVSHHIHAGDQVLLSCHNQELFITMSRNIQSDEY